MFFKQSIVYWLAGLITSAALSSSVWGSDSPRALDAERLKEQGCPEQLLACAEQLCGLYPPDSEKQVAKAFSQHWPVLELLARRSVAAIWSGNTSVFEESLSLEGALPTSLFSTGWSGYELAGVLSELFFAEHFSPDTPTMEATFFLHPLHWAMEAILILRIHELLDARVPGLSRSPLHRALKQSEPVDKVSVVFHQVGPLQNVTAEYIESRPDLNQEPVLLLVDTPAGYRLRSQALKRTADLVRLTKHSAPSSPAVRLNASEIHVFGGGEINHLRSFLRRQLDYLLESRDQVTLYLYPALMYGLLGDNPYQVHNWTPEQEPNPPAEWAPQYRAVDKHLRALEAADQQKAYGRLAFQLLEDADESVFLEHSETEMTFPSEGVVQFTIDFGRFEGDEDLGKTIRMVFVLD